MSIDVNQLNRVLEKQQSTINALLASVSGLAAQLKASQGQEGLKVAHEKASTIAREMSRRSGVKIDKQMLDLMFNNPLV